ncbi:MAG TPA: bifunctional phosphoglucose/phosphomannose isomerase [Dehalococcoidia bacterium]|nr:bifunctional phosphoglucose/phosphomannose isomerase [Dehalococcoidia bacterium]
MSDQQDRARLFDLDAPEAYVAADPSDMLRRIRELPQQVTDAWQGVAALDLPADCRRPAGVLLLGMGGSAIGGDLARDLVAGECPVPFQVNRDYDLPAWVDRRTLVIASSYSGNTEETLSGLEQALARGAAVVGVSSGGRVTDRLRAAGRPVIPIQYESQPRAALGHSLIPVLGILRAAGLIADPARSVEAARRALDRVLAENGPEVATVNNRAKGIARTLHGRVAVVYGGSLLSSVARRWKTQINENSKAWAFWEENPELCHNAVLGYQFPPLADRVHVLLLDSPLISQRTRIRAEVTQRILDRQSIPHDRVAGQETDRLAALLELILLGDLTSYYLALLNGVDPTPVEMIDYLKAELAGR